MIDGGVDEELRCERQACVPRHQRHDRRQVAARRVPADYDLRRGIPRELLPVGVRPFERGPGVLDPGRERRLRCEPIVDRHDGGPRLLCELAANLVVGVEIADRVAAAVVVDEDALGTGVAVDPYRDVTGRSGDRAIRYVIDIWTGAGEGDEGEIPVASFLDAQFRRWRPFGGGRIDGFDDRGDLWVQGHDAWYCPWGVTFQPVRLYASVRGPEQHDETVVDVDRVHLIRPEPPPVPEHDDQTGVCRNRR